MPEGEIRQAAGMYGLVARMEAMKAKIEGMKAYNLTSGDQPGSYGQKAFDCCHDELLVLAKRLEEEI